MNGRRILVAAGAAVIAWAVAPVPVAGHTAPEHVTPPSGASLVEPPTVVVVRFDDELDATRSRLDLVDESGQIVASGGVDLNILDHQTMRLDVPSTVTAGAFAVRWEVTGMSDGHTVTGESGFAVGDADPAAALAAGGDIHSDDGRGAGTRLLWPTSAAAIGAGTVVAVIASRRARRHAAPTTLR